MADIRDEFKRTKEIRCECIDEITAGPQNRAKNILNKLQQVDGEIENYDLLCFAVLFLAGQLAAEPDFKQEVESLAYKLHHNHYFNGAAIGLYNESEIVQRTRVRLQNSRDSRKKPDGDEG